MGWMLWRVLVAAAAGACLALTAGQRETVDDFIINQVDPNIIRASLRHLTQKPHLGGTQAEWENARWVADTWRAQGWDQVHLVPYQVLLSYPKNDTPNLVSVLDEAGEVVWTSEGWQEPLYAPEEASPEVLPNFNAYSAPGLVEGDVVYAHFGRVEDFELLEAAGVDVAGRIVVARYGEIFRANIADNAEQRGAVGVIFYSDPQQYAPLGEDAVYPDTVYLPPSGAPAGTIHLDGGDPLTRLYPAIESAYRLSESEAKLPTIPVQPISYRDASQILSRMDGALAPLDWQGGLNLTYRLGPGLEAAGWSVQLDVHTTNTHTTIYNVVAMMEGSEEPDRYVVLGNHRDGWNFGALDPSSSTSALLEVSRVLALLRNETGWEPRRSVVLCSWGAEEYGLIGSVEWTEQFGQQLMDRAVAYFNVDMAIGGNVTLRALAAPLLYDILFQAAQKVPNPNPDEVSMGRPTLYDTWVLWRPDPAYPGRPSVGSLGSGSDYKGFQYSFGVPSLDIRYTHGPDMYAQPLYHTLYETFELVDELFDRGFHYHAAITQMWAVMAVDLADAKILPFSLLEYSSFVAEAHRQLVQDYGDLISTRNISMEYFAAAVDQFSQSTANFTSNLPLGDIAKPLEARRVNDQMMMVERAFIDRNGLPGRPDYNHVVMAPSSFNEYSSSAFAGLTDALTGIEELSPEEQEERWKQFAQHLAAVTHLVATAAKVLTLDLW